MRELKKSSSWLGNAAILLMATVITLLVTEFAFRQILGSTIVLFPRNHAAATYGSYVLRNMEPNSVFWHQSIDGQWRFKINNKGFRDDKDYSYENPSGAYRVLVLGDSHTAGFEVHQREVFTRILEEALRKRGVHAEVLNTGVSGFGTAEQLAYLENEGLRYRPDAIVVAFFGNDYLDSARSGLFRLVDGNLAEASRHHAPAVEIIKLTGAIPGLKWLGENSYAYSYLFNAVWDFAKQWSMRRASKEMRTVEQAPAQVEYAIPEGEVSPAEEALAVALLKRIVAAGKSHNIKTILADIPTPEGAYGIRSSLTSATRSASAAEFSHVLGSETYLSGRPATQLVHVPNGHRHINAYAHRRLGEALADILSAK